MELRFNAMSKFLALPIMLAGAALAQEAPAAGPKSLTREGPYWKRTHSGVVTHTGPLRRLHITTRAKVIVRGSDREDVAYVLTQRTPLRSEAQARQALGSVITTSTPRGDLARIMIVPTNSRLIMSQLDLEVPRRLLEMVVDTESGDVQAFDLDGNVFASTNAGQIRLDRIGKNVVTRTGGGEIRLGRIGGTVKSVSAGGSIIIDSTGGETTCETAGGDVILREAGGPVTAWTEGGNISVERAAASVFAKSAAGLIEVFQALGNVTAETRGGSIQVGAAKGVTCESGAGAIRVKNISGPLHMSTAVGSILAELAPGTRLENSFLSAGSGDITVIIPSNLAMRVEARNATAPGARIVSEFSEIRFRPPQLLPFQPALAEGALNGGGPVLKIATAGGTIYLRKQK